jgi:hypothetical protein
VNHGQQSPNHRCAGRTAIEKALSTSIAGQQSYSQFTPVGAALTPGTAVFSVQYRGDNVRAQGVDRIVVFWTVEVQNGRIASFVFKADTTDPQTAKFVTAFQAAPAAPAQMPAQMPYAGAGGGADSGLAGLLALLPPVLTAAAVLFSRRNLQRRVR